LSRSLGIALTPKAAKYLEKRPYAPGQHGRTKRKADSDFAVRLREKQRLRAQYGIREAQLRKTFNDAKRSEGLTGENLVEFLEMRLDALVLVLVSPEPWLRQDKWLSTVTFLLMVN
jgi:small subunit ribosomal protein S4